MLDLDGMLRTEDTTDLSSPYYQGLKGRAEFPVKIQGTFEQPEISGIITFTRPVIEGYPAQTAVADILYRRNLLKVRRLTIRNKDELHKLTGEIYFRNAEDLFDFSEPRFALQASLENAEIQKFVRIFFSDFLGSGKLKSDVQISGTWTSPEITGKAVMENATVHSVSFDRSSFTYRFSGRKLHFDSMQVRQGSSVLTAEGMIDPEGSFSYQAVSDRLMLKDLIQKDIEGDIMFSLKSEGHGTFDNPSLFVDGKVLRGSLKGKPVGSGIIKAFLKDREFSIQADIIDQKIRIEADGRLEDEIPWNAEIEFSTGRFDFLIASFLKDVPDDLILSLNGTVSLRGDRRNISGTSRLRHLLLSLYGYSFTNEKEIEIALDNSQLMLNRIFMRSGNTSLSIGGSMDIGKKYDLILEGRSALSPFKALSRKIGVLKGDAEFVFSVAGDWNDPRINGGMNVSDGVFGLKDYYHRVSDVNGFLYIDEDRIVLKNLSGEVGGGLIDVSGIMYLKKFDIKNFYLETEMKDISTSVSNNFAVKFGGNILLKGTPESQKITGDITIIKARYAERVEWRSWLMKAKSAEAFRGDISNIEKAELNIRILGKENIVVDNNIARATVRADMLLRGTVYRPVLFGRLDSKEGVVFFRNNQFRIIAASADFSDPHRINPFMEISAETLTKGYKIKMNLEGQADRFNLSLSSDPPLKEMDILSLLTVGKTREEVTELGLEGGIGASEAASFVTGKLQDVIEERLTSITGLDRLQIDPYVSKTTGTVEPRVTVSKRLIGEKMFVTYTTTPSSQEEEIIRLEYFLSKNVSLLGVRDERGIFGGDISFRFQFK
jgi:translocation and assembly module TamB